jgi:hypothetical protein
MNKTNLPYFHICKLMGCAIFTPHDCSLAYLSDSEKTFLLDTFLVSVCVPKLALLNILPNIFPKVFILKLNLLGYFKTLF